MARRLQARRKAAKALALLMFALPLATSPAWAQGGSIAGTVLDADGGPLGGVLVSLSNAAGGDAGMSAVSDDNGSFSISGLAAGTYTATASSVGLLTSSETVEVAAGGRTSVEFRLSASYHEAVLVTAEKVEENILDVPMTISAFDSDQLRELVIQDRTDLQSLVPGLQFGDEMDQEGQGTVIRGIGTRLAGQTHSDRAVATYIDGAYTVGVYGTLPGGGFDLERIEVARGPQGTLNGRNSIAGSINLVYKKPTREWDLDAMTEVTDVSQTRFNAAFGGPINDYLSFRLTGGIHSGDGRQRNIGLGGDYDKPDHAFWAPQLRFTTDRFDANVRWSRVEDKGSPRSLLTLSNLNRTDPQVTLGPQGGQLATPSPTATSVANDLYLYETPNPAIDAGCPIGVPGFRCGDINNEVALNFTGWQDSESDQVTFYAQYQLTEGLSVRYSFHDSDASMINVKDADYSNRVPLGEDPNTLDHTIASDGLATPFEDTHYVLPYLYDETSHEVHVSSSFPGAFNFIAGLFAYENSTFWDLVRVDKTRPFRFGSADQQAAAASPIFGFVPVSTCQELLTGVIEAFGIGTSDPALAYQWDGLYWYCPEGVEHTETVRFYTGATSETQAAFFNGNYRLNDRWTLSGGLRYTEDEKAQDPDSGGGFAILTIGSVVGVFFPNGGVADAHTWGRTIGHVSLEYTTESDNLVYGRFSTGYRAGGFNSPIPGVDPPLIEEETLANYEVGMKGLFLDSRLQLAIGLWFNDFDGFQLNGTQPPPPGLQLPAFTDTPLAEYTSNIDDTQLWGADFEFSYWFNDNWRLRGFYAFQDSQIGPHSSVVWGNPNAQYAEWEHIDFDTGQTVTSFYPLPVDLTGNKLPMQPEHKLALTVSHTRPLGSRGSVQLLGTYTFTDSQHPNIGNIPVYEIPSYGRWDAAALWTAPGSEWSVALFAQNIGNEIGLVEFLPISGLGSNPSLGYPTNPREVGVQLRWTPFN